MISTILIFAKTWNIIADDRVLQIEKKVKYHVDAGYL